MSRGICWAYEEDSVERAAQLMSERQVRRLPIVNQAKRLVGIVSLGDFAVETEEIEPAAEALSGISQHWQSRWAADKPVAGARVQADAFGLTPTRGAATMRAAPASPASAR